MEGKGFRLMKKFFLGLFVGVFVATSGTALATDGIKNMVDKVVQGQFPVKVNGEYTDTPAIVIDGQSFLPVRSFGETVGYAVYFDAAGEIMLKPDLSKIKVIHGMSDEAQAWKEKRSAEIEQLNARNQEYNNKRRELEIAIGKNKGYTEIIQDQIDRAQSQYDKYNQRQLNFIDMHDERSEKLDEYLKQYQVEIDKLNVEKTEKVSDLQRFETELEELQASAPQ